jgi:hypothetical protein
MRRTLELEDRRTFCKRLASAAACASGAVLLQDCSGNPTQSIPGTPLPTVTGTLSGTGVSITLDAGSPLAATGGMALVTSNAGDFLVRRTSATTFCGADRTMHTSGVRRLGRDEHDVRLPVPRLGI